MPMPLARLLAMRATRPPLIVRLADLVAEPGIYVIDGQAATLRKTAHVLQAGAGAYLITGQDADLSVSIILNAETGLYTHTGQDAALLRGYVMRAETGLYTLDGQDAGLARAITLAAEQGTYTLTGQDATLRQTAHVMAAEQGSYTIAGQDAELTHTSGTFTPADLAGLECWYDADLSGITFGSGALVAQIDDLSGNGQHATQATGSLQPELLANEIGSHAALDFANDVMACGGVTVTNTGTLFALIRSDVVAVNCPIGRGANNNSTPGAVIRVLNEGDAQIVIGDGSSRVATNFRTDIFEAGDVMAMVGCWDSGNIFFQFYNVTQDAGDSLADTHSLGSLGTAGIMLGAQLPTSIRFDGKIACAGKYNVNVGTQGAQDLIDYMVGLAA